MMPAVKAFDPVMGVDIHIIQPPGPVPPVPIPHPFVGMVLDPMDFIPIIGASVKINGLPRGLAGTGVKALPPHIPIGGVFVKPPGNEGEIFMGSATVVIDGDPQSYMALPVLTCQDIGMPAPPRPKKKSKAVSLMLPTSVVLAIPGGPPVLIGGPPTISMMAMAMNLGMAALGKIMKKLAKSKLGKALKKAKDKAADAFKKVRQKLFKNMKPGFLKCKILRAEPVDILTGEVSVEQSDFELPWPVPLEWTRNYRSQSTYHGLCGHGWQTPADARLLLEPDGTVLFHDGGPGATVFPSLPQREPVRELVDGAVLERTGLALYVRLKAGLIYRFPHFAPGQTEVLVERISDRRGHSNTFRRDGQGLAEIVSSAGPRVEVVSRGGRILEMRLHHPDEAEPRRLVRYEYEHAGDLAAVVDALDAPYRFRYSNHCMTQHTDRNGLSFYYDFDQANAEGRVVHAWGDGGLYNYAFAYDTVAQQVRVVDSLGHASVIDFDDRNLPVKETDPLGGETIFEYDDVGRCSAVVDPGQRRTEYHYDERGNLIKLVQPDGTAVITEFDEASQPVKITDPGEQVWTLEWGAGGLLRREIDPTGAATVFGYDERGYLGSITDALGHTQRIETDACGNIVALVDALGRRTAVTLDTLGNVTRVVDALGHVTERFHDAKSRLTRVVMATGDQISLEHDAEDNPIAYRDEEGKVTRFQYRGLGQLSRIDRPNGTGISYRYDTEERLICVTNERGERYEFTYDALGQVITEKTFDGRLLKYTWSPSGHLARVEYPDGSWRELECDARGGLIAETAPDGVTRYKRDRLGQILEAVLEEKDRKILTRFERDPLGRILVEEQGGQRLEYAYDAVGRRTERRMLDGVTTRYAYDPEGDLSQVTHGAFSLSFQRDALGREVGRRALEGRFSIESAYDALGQLIEQKATAPSPGSEEPAILVQRQWHYDRTGRVERIRDERWGLTTYRYDSVDQLLGARRGRLSEAFAYDEAGSIRRMLKGLEGEPEEGGGKGGWEIAPGNLLMRTERARYAYDRRGRRVLKQELGEGGAGDGKRTEYRWDSRDRLREVRLPSGMRVVLTYDAFGRRVRKEVLPGDGSAPRVVELVWDGDVLAADLDPRRGARCFVHEPGTFVPLLQAEQGEVFAVVNDHLGMPKDLIDQGGRVAWSAAHSAWGQVVEEYRDPASRRKMPVESPFRLLGQYADEETGLCYTRFRYFDAEVGRWVSSDPLGIDGGKNLYAFDGNPASDTDSLGLKCAKKPFFSKKSHHHIKKRHVSKVSGESATKWKGGKYEKLTQKTLGDPDRVNYQTGGRAVYEKDFGDKVVGHEYNPVTGKYDVPVNKVRVVVEPEGEVVTSFPQKDWKKW